MYKLKRLELLGFKSFADRTRLDFADGTAGVVGPNGCGKSNLSDAITWVLGEQSAKLLRGERMADVIFNGTGLRPPTSMAEVSLTLVDPEYEAAGVVEEVEEPAVAPPGSNGDGILADAGVESSGSNGHGTSAAAKPPALRHRAGEITVTRRLFRSGESEYLINGEISRLRDIQDLFMGTGLGPESYAIIEQGRIGQILSSKPSDRRLIIEEAAGVSKFKTRKRLAEAKLESSRQNLSRITDILEEVTKQVNSLKRQASKARRYKELHDELRGRLKVVLTSRLAVLDQECARLRAGLAEIQEACAAGARELESLEHAQRAAALRYEELENQLTQLRQKLTQLELEEERLRSRLEQARQQVATLEARRQEAAQERAGLEAQLRLLEQQTEAHAHQREQLQGEDKAAQEMLAGLLAQQDSLNAQALAAEQEVERCRQAMIDAVSRAADLRNQLVQAEEAGLALERQWTRTEAERQRVGQEHERRGAELQSYLSEHQRETHTLADLTQSLATTTADLEQARALESAKRSELEAQRRESSAAVARKQTLEESLARHAYSTESVRRLLAGEIPINGHNFRPLGVLADFVEVDPGYEEVVEDFLKHELECVVVERHEQARSGIALLRSEGSGRSTFFVTHLAGDSPAQGHAETAVRNEPGVVAAVREIVRFGSMLGLNGDLALPALENAYLVQDAASAERLASAYPHGHFLTPEGEHYHHRLVTGGKGSSAGPLAMRRDFRELERRTLELEDLIRVTEATLAETSARVTRRDEEFRGLTAAKLEAEKKAVVADEKLRQTREAHDRAAEQLQTLEKELAALRREQQEVQARQSHLREELQKVEQEKASRDAAITQAAQRQRDLRASLDRLAQEIVEARARVSMLEERLRSAEAESQRLQAQAEEIRGRRARLEQQSAAWQEEQARLAQENETNRARAAEVEAESAAGRQELQKLELDSQEARQRREELTPQVDAARTALEAHRERRSEVEVALARAESDHAHHAQQCRDELNAEPAALLAELAPESRLAGEVLQAAEDEVRQLKTRLENLGPVNMMALEELQEAEERFAFLETQRQDLLASIEDTAQAIREIDQVSRQQFLEAFKAINANFAESFRTLFGGGIGEMRLSDETDPDSGIDIAAQPPGKRLQNILLLSGGEKAMAALALLIAIFHYTPSPFCVLDEVDAPLDETNIDRFTRMIQAMSRHTQFILITHNKRTMEIAKVMYGVTMEEPGVSKLVSVRFDAVAREPVAA